MTKPLWETSDADLVNDGLASLLSFRTNKTHATYGDYGTLSNGSRVNQQTYDALRVAAYLSGWGPLVVTQGGLNGTAVAASASTHVGLDVADVMCRGRTLDDIYRFVEYAMACGAIGFIRGSTKDNINDGMVPHIHFVMVNADHAHKSARSQIYNLIYGYKYGGAGLGGAPYARWWGPKKQPLVEWADSIYNPKNGWRPTS